MKVSRFLPAFYQIRRSNSSNNSSIGNNKMPAKNSKRKHDGEGGDDDNSQSAARRLKTSDASNTETDTEIETKIWTENGIRSFQVARTSTATHPDSGSVFVAMPIYSDRNPRQQTRRGLRGIRTDLLGMDEGMRVQQMSARSPESQAAEPVEAESMRKRDEDGRREYAQRAEREAQREEDEKNALKDRLVQSAAPLQLLDHLEGMEEIDFDTD